MLDQLWYAVEFSGAIAMHPKLIKVFDRDIVLYRTADNRLHAMQNTCVHRGASLALGKVNRDCIVCPYHGWQFQPDGTCVEIPSQPPTATIPKSAKINTYPVREKYGWIWLYLGDGEPIDLPNLVDFPQSESSGLQAIRGEFEWQVNYERAIENGLDFAHAPFVHAGAFGNPDLPEIAKIAIETEGLGASGTVYLAATPPRGLWKFLVKKERQPIKTRTGFYLPNLTFLEVNLPFGRLIIWTAHVPIDSQHTISKWMNFRSFFTGKWADRDAYQRTMKIFEQDRPIVESQQPQSLPPSLQAELYLPADALQLEYRKLRQQALTEAEGRGQKAEGCS
jgi:phenylpropionate dioxygenase-like ring-hydroxylating dioxygenase large terminal subunit